MEEVARNGEEVRGDEPRGTIPSLVTQPQLSHMLTSISGSFLGLVSLPSDPPPRPPVMAVVM